MIFILERVLSTAEVDILRYDCDQMLTKINDEVLLEASCAVDPFENEYIAENDPMRTSATAYVQYRFRMHPLDAAYKQQLERILFHTIPSLL